ncbi:MAG: hypothetical protein JNJ40_17185 [Bacteroidia bacterium]|nr:hypothetical protein [Bacteroidia bacterium]
MKISTLALGALISFSVNAFAQEKPKTEPKAKHTKTTKTKTKCVKPKETVTTDASLQVEPKKQRVCEACGRG